VKRVSYADTLKKEEKPMLSVIKILGFGMRVGVLSMAIAPLLFKNATEQDVTLVYISIMDFAVLLFLIKGIRRIFQNSCRKKSFQANERSS
jgi:uncharacterized protein with PQ loop repeat